MTFSNRGFETIGIFPGLAASWTLGTVVTSFEYAGFAYDGTADEHGFENFEGQWTSNLLYNYEFDQPLTELEPADYVTFGPGDKFVEDFEEAWDLNHEYIYVLGLLEQASYDTSPQPQEDFSQNWDTNENYQFALAPGDLSAATYDASPQTYEDFEEAWVTGYTYAPITVGSGTGSAASYDITPEAFEDFEEDWTLVMTTM